MSAQNPTATPGELSAVNAENPWPGLLSFREADQRWFQGRRDETAELARHIRLESLTVLFAISGIGKSSLLQAGVFPALRKDGIFPVYVRLDHAGSNMDLAGQVFDTVAQSALSADVTAPKPRGGETLWEYFHHVESEFLARDGSRVVPLLVFDQFEEIFTLGRNPQRVAASDSFLEQLADLAEGTVPALVAGRWSSDPKDRDNYIESGEYKVLISLREDFLAELTDQRRRIASIPQKRYRLRQMNGEGALAAVGQAKDLVDQTVATQIVRYVADEKKGGSTRRERPLKDLEVEPALLSVVCRELNNRRRQKGERAISADLLDGAQEEVLSDFYIRSIEGVPASVRAFVEDEMITVAGARNSVPLDNARAVPGMTDAIIERLVESRLIRRENRKNEVRLELTHDLLTGVVRASRDARRQAEAQEVQRRELEAAQVAAEAAEAEARKARAAANRFRVVALAAGITALIAGGSYLYARQQTALANQQTQVATAQTTRAEKAAADALAAQKAEAEQRTLATQNADTATKEAARATSEAALAEQQRQRAEQQSVIAQQRQKDADDQRARAEAQTKIADDNAKRAQENQTLAEAQRKLAEEQTKLADQRRVETETANKTIAKETSQSVATEAVNQIPNNPAKALGLIAHSLTLDPDSRAARALAFDQLLRGSWAGAKPVTPGAPGAEPFVHPPLIHPDAAACNASVVTNPPAVPCGVLFAAYSHDGSKVVTVSKDKVVRVWNGQSGALLGALPAQAKIVNFAAFSPDGNRLVTASGDNVARVFDIRQLNQPSQVLTLTHAAPVKSAVFNAAGNRIVTASQDKTAQVWDASSGAKLATMTHPQTVNYAEFSQDGNFVVTACVDHYARVWNSANGSPVFAMSHTAEVKSASFSPDGNHIVTASVDSNARIWDVKARAPVYEPMKHNGAVYFAAFSPDNLRIATASLDGQARVWDATSGRAVTAPLLHRKAVASVAFSPDNRRLLSASEDGTAQVWDVWYEFSDAADLIRLLEGISKSSAVTADLPPLPSGEDARRIADVRSKVSRQPANSFLPWFFSHRE